MALTSAVGVLSLLEESDPTLVHYGLAKLEGLVPTFWAEISDALTTIEDLAEDVGHDDSQLASLVASKVYFHLGDLEASLSFALGAGPLFQLNERSEYVHTLASKAIDEYVAQRVVVSTQTVYAATSPHASPRAAAFPEVPDPNAITDIDDRLTALVERMFETSFNASEFHEAVGIAMDAMRIDLLKRAITGSNDVATFVGYALDVALSVVKHREFRRAVLAVLIEIYGSLKTGADSFGQAQCSLFLSDTEAVSALLLELIRGSDDDHLVALQLAFDLVDDAPQSFLAEIRGVLAGAGTSTDGEFTARLERLNNILSGEPTIDLFLRFLYRNNNTDLLILNTIKEKIPERNAVLHEATCFAHSFMQAGTTNDSWLRSNIDWLSRATNWSKFSATAGLGVIHKGHYAEGLNLLAPYLPGAGAGGSPYSQGGALFGLGLINANHGADVTPFLCDALRNAGVNPVVQHGACLGIGLAAMATGNEEIYNQLKEAVLYTDETVAAAAAALSMGLVMLGTANERAINELIAYGRDTSHVKITRAVAMGVAFIMFGREESCDVLTDELGRDQDPLLRTCAMWTLALGFVATANNSAVRKLLHFAVSDVDDEVRRSAVLGLGFVLANTPDVVPATVALLATSFNPHVRYGAAMAVGVACAGTASTEALDLLETLWKDQEDFVRQGALLATSMVLVQTNAAEEPRVQTFRDHIAERSADKREELLTKFGSILAAGVIDAGGRNVTISLRSRSGHTSISAAVGLTLFCQGWYWYPYHHMLSLAFMPTAVVGLDASLAMPKFSFASNAPPSRYAYPDPTKPPEKKVAAKVEKAVLSTAKRSAANAAAKQDAEEGGDGDVADMDATPTTGDEPMPDAEAGGDADEAAAEEAAAEPEATSEVLENPTRVTPRQVDVVSFSVDERFVPIKLLRSSSRKMSGILVLKDNTPDDDIEYVAAKAPAGGGDDEPEPPAQFVYVSDDED